MRRVLLALLLALPWRGFAADAVASCTAPEFRQFDFWLGEWDVRRPDGTLAGTNRIQREYGGCVVHERYTSGRDYSGESLNIYDAGRKVWHQTWVDTDGLLLVLEGALADGKMALAGEVTGIDGKKVKHRITWTPNADGSVRQLWETAGVEGNWSVAFDGRYTRKPGRR